MEAEKYDLAIPLFEEAEASYRKALGAGHVYSAQTILGHGICLRRMERHEQAATKLSEAFELLTKLGPTMQGAARRAAQELAMADDALGRTKDAEQWRAKAEGLKPRTQ